MIRTLLVCVCLATLCGCSSIHKTVNKGEPDKPAAPPKQYEYHDMGRGGNPNFAHPNPGATSMLN
jgi:hypothetical protein